MWHGAATRATFGAVIVTVVIAATGGAIAMHQRPAAMRPAPTVAVRDAHSFTAAARPAPPSGAAAIVVRMPSITVVKLDARGHVAAAATNTGTAPAQGDLVYVVTPDGSYERSDIDVADRQWTGDFSTPMEFHTQVAAEHGR